MNKNRNTADNRLPAVIMMPEAKIKQLFFGMNRLAEMHMGLIGLYEEESRLKKQHKPYLYLREHADQVCRKDKQEVDRILKAVLDPENTELAYPDKEGAAKKMEEAKKEKAEPEEFDPDGCRGCVRYEDCEEYFMQIRAEKKKKAAEQDNFNLPDGLVMMSTDNLGTMQDDMLQLTEALDHMVSMLRSGVTGVPIKKAAAEEAVKRGSALSEEVFKRWDDADFVAMC